MRRIVIFLSVILTFANVGYGQDAQDSKNTADQTLQSSGRVNPSTLGMEFNLPLGSYKGRGFDLPLGLNYTSKVWRFEEDNEAYSGTKGTPNRIYDMGVYSDNAAAGWTSSLAQPYIEYTGEFKRFDNVGRPLPETPGPPVGDYYIRRITIFLPGGESHELRRSDSDAPTSNPSPGSYPPASEWEGTFLASDGSGLKYFQDTTTSIFRLYMPNGSFYDFNWSKEEHMWSSQIRKANKLTDANGNYVSYNASETGYPYGSWTDQLGRKFPIMIPIDNPQSTGATEVLTDSFTLPGMSAAYTFKWKRLKGTTAENSAFSENDFYNQPLNFVGGTDTLGTNTEAHAPHLFPSGIPMGNACSGDNSVLYITNPVDQTGVLTFNPVVLSEIILPTGASYKFIYNEYGEIEHIVYPTGGQEEFTYGQVATLAHLDAAYQKVNRGVTLSKVFENGSDPSPAVSQYYAVASANNFRTSVIGPDGMQTDNYMHRGVETLSCSYTIGDTDNSYGTRWGYDNVLAGMTYETRTFSSGSSPHILTRTLTKWETSPTTVILRSLPIPSLYLQRNPRVYSAQSITYDGDQGVSTVTKFEYDSDKDNAGSPLNVTAKRDYAYTVVSSGGNSFVPETSTSLPPAPVTVLSDPTTGLTPARSTETTYKTDSTYQGRNILKLPNQVIVRDGGSTGAIKSKSTLDYDESTYLVSDTPGGTVPGWIDPSMIPGLPYPTIRGLATTAKSWTDPAVSGAFVVSHVQYNQFGSGRKTWDGNGNVTETIYTDNFSDTVNRYTFAFPTETISPIPGGNGSTSAFHSTVKYSFPAGLPVSSVDANGQTTTMEYNDPLLRPTKVVAPNTQQTITEYGGGTSAATRWVRTSAQIDSLTWKQGLVWYDGLSRTVRNESVDDAGNATVMTCYDSAGRVSGKSNPFRGYTNQTCSSSLEWTVNTFDAYSRPWRVTTPDGAVVETTYGVVTSGTQVGTWVSVKDQALKERRSVTNAFGQLTRVDEPTTSGLGTVTSPNQQTNYSYDVLNDLLTVQQNGTNTIQCGGVGLCSQTRTFTYDALSRLKTAANPESGTVNYGYDSNGNLTSKADARSISTTYTYDTLNRAQSRIYSDSTPAVTYYYDNITNAKGKLIKVTSSVSTTEYTGFDISSRVTGHKQTTDGTAYTTGYTYNLAGGLVDETYPSTRVVRNVLDANGDLSMVESKKNSSSGFWSYANSFTYTPAGAVSSMQLGNGHWESTTYNNRLQPTQIALGTAPAGTDLLKLNYNYGTTANNGNVLSQTITVPTVGINNGFTAVQTYSYDELNRLLNATEMESTTQTWKQAFKYDRFGNRRFDEPNTTMPSSFVNQAVTDPTISASNNRINATGYTFDNAGNVTADAAGQTYTYDAENKQKQASNGSGTLGQYWYDGDGKRVKKYVPGTGETTIFVYDAAGKEIAEYSTIVAGTSTAKVNYLTDDHLGSPRINTDQNGAVLTRHDYHPFGEEIYGLGGRTTGVNYGDDSVRKQFTGYERDVESGSDFAEARVYSNVAGRFYSPDPENLSATDIDPQTWNAYVYVRGNPLRFTDPEGLEVKVCDTSGKCWNHSDEAWRKARDLDGDNTYVTRVSGKTGLESGAIYNNEGELIGTFQQTSHDSGIQRLLWGAAPKLDIWETPIRIGGNWILPVFGSPIPSGKVEDYVAGTVARDVVVGSLPKAAALKALADLEISEAARRSAESAIRRATTTSTIEITATDAGQVIIRTSRPGAVSGYQVMEYTIESDGSKTVIQKAFSDADTLIHYDPKTQ